ncbi:unnamed protein product [Vitrella brassicaformis CCMP3155]|uniref:Uncharacterized protein n=1 Tax=Vitrella brassicaformis (strain CCMP3155) TaxID=1169540 RepID=A0A0G4EAN6_VITBC|nr:unnamed protein product [Vitrella brassicaformis CCMP3155]|eukprot:CEL92485.1 unnamed protein product [Vitrella brassicaformis CCMP3155]
MNRHVKNTHDPIADILCRMRMVRMQQLLGKTVRCYEVFFDYPEHTPDSGLLTIECRLYSSSRIMEAGGNFRAAEVTYGLCPVPTERDIADEEEQENEGEEIKSGGGANTTTSTTETPSMVPNGTVLVHVFSHSAAFGAAGQAVYGSWADGGYKNLMWHEEQPSVRRKRKRKYGLARERLKFRRR